jgi:hypothetical protein
MKRVPLDPLEELDDVGGGQHGEFSLLEVT